MLKKSENVLMWFGGKEINSRNIDKKLFFSCIVTITTLALGLVNETKKRKLMWNNLFLIYIEKVTWIELIQQTAQLILCYIKYINGDLLLMARTNKTFSEKK